jgi:hypothetical protein
VMEVSVHFYAAPDSPVWSLAIAEGQRFPSQLRGYIVSEAISVATHADILSAVEGRSVENMPVQAVHQLLLGEQDSWVQTRMMRSSIGMAQFCHPKGCWAMQVAV